MDRAELLVDKDVRSHRERLEVLAAIVKQFADLARLEIEDEQCGGAVAVGQEIDPPAVPHRRGVGPRPVGDLGQLARVEVVGEHLLREAAVVALPGAEVPEDAVVGDGVAVGGEGGQSHRAVDRHPRWNLVRHVGNPFAGRRKRTVMCQGERQRFRKASLDRHEEEPAAEGARGVQTRRVEQDVLAVGGPADDAIDARMIGQAPRHAPLGRHDIDVHVPFVIRGEGDLLAVGRKERPSLQPRPARQPHRHAPLAAHAPQVIGVPENDVGATDRRLLKQRLGGCVAGG